MENLTITEIQARCDALAKAMSDKGVVTPSAELVVKSTGLHVVLWSSVEKRAFMGGTEYLHTIRADDPFAAADAFIAALPDPATEGERKFTRALADAIDIATEYALPDAVVAPVKAAMIEVNAQLLAAPTKEPLK